ncbi:MAG: CRTAC1 family protein [Planctomycetaceae bacterium]
MAERRNQDSDQTEEIQNDEVVGRAIRMSLAVFVLLAAGAGVGWWLTRPKVAPVAGPATKTALPAARSGPQIEIPAIPFTEITQAAGIDFVHENGAEGEKLLPETMGGGGAFFDFDNDGDQDLLCVNSGIWPWAAQKPAQTPVSALYANDGAGRFTNVTAGSGIDVAMYGNGVACGDVDNDGDVDLFISCLGPNHLFLNEGQGHFRDVTEMAQVAGDAAAWSTSCGFIDIENDGDLDLFVCNYIQWDRDTDKGMNFTLDGQLRAYGRPTDFKGAFPMLYLNDGKGVFTDASVQLGVQVRDPNTGAPLSKSLGVTFPDLNADGRPDIMVANDTVQNLLFHSQPGGGFQESAAGSGVAFDNAGAASGAMGLDFGSFRNSAAVGIAIGNFATEMTALYVCQNPGMAMPVFRDEAVSNGIGPVTRTDLKFGVLFLDADLDGRLDLFENNGHLEEDISIVQSSQQYEQPPHLLWNCGPEEETEFVMLSEQKTSADFAKRMVGRGATMADIDADGDLDLALFASGARPRLLRNDQAAGHHWLRVRLRGVTVNRDAIGAQLQLLLPDGTTQYRTVMPTRSYQSQVELPVTFGLGKNTTVKELRITWPGGQQQLVEPGAVDRQIEVQQTENPAR